MQVTLLTVTLVIYHGTLMKEIINYFIFQIDIKHWTLPVGGVLGHRPCILLGFLIGLETFHGLKRLRFVDSGVLRQSAYPIPLVDDCSGIVWTAMSA